PRSARRFLLTARAEHAAAPGDHRAAERSAANRTGLAGATIHLQKRRVAVFAPPRAQIRLRADAVLFDEIGEPLRKDAGNARPLLPRQAVRRTRRSDPRREEDLVGIDIAETGDHALVQQARLDGAAALPAARHEVV